MQAPVQTQSSKWKNFFKTKNKLPILEPQAPIIENPHQPQQKQNAPEILDKILSLKPVLKQKLSQKSVKHQQQKEDIAKQTHSQTTNDSNPHQLKQDKLKQHIQETLSGSAKNILSTLQSRNKKQAFVEKINQQKKERQNSSLLQILNGTNEEPKHQKAKTKLKTGHYKIFNPQHFSVKGHEIKTSIHRWQYGSGQTPNKLLIHSWNVNGIRARMNNNDILPYLNLYKPDIFCINETKLDEKSFDQNPFKFFGYFSYWNFPKYSLGYSGVAVFSKYPAIQMFEDIHIPEHSKQGRVITLEFDKFVLINIYVPTTGRDLERLDYRVKQYDPAFHEYVLQIQLKFPEKALIICGDLNVAHGDIDCHIGRRMKQGNQPAFTVKERASFSALLKKACLVDTFRYFHPDLRSYTWWNMRRGGRKRNGDLGIGKRLDYFLVDEKSMKYVKSSEIRKDVEGCDHCPIELTLEFQ